MKTALNGYLVSIIYFCSISQQKYITKIKKLAEKYPKKVKIKYNEDGTICAKLPIKALKLSIIERELSEEQRQEMSRRFKERMYKED